MRRCAGKFIHQITNEDVTNKFKGPTILTFHKNFQFLFLFS